MAKIVAEQRSARREGDSTVVEMEVTGVVGEITDVAMRGRARGRALLESGVLDTAYNTVADIPAGKIQRMTEIVDEREAQMQTTYVPVLGTLTMTKVYTVVVNS